MELADIEKNIREIENNLEGSMLENALLHMENLLLVDSNWELSNRLEKIKTSYHYMLQYLMQGVTDPQRDTLRKQFIIDSWEICDQLHFHLQTKYTQTKYIITYRQNKQEGNLSDLIGQLEAFEDNLAVLQLTDNRPESKEKELMAHEQCQAQLFDHVWTHIKWSEEDLEAANAALQSSTLIVPDLCLMVSAVTMSLLQCFDERKIMYALNAAHHSEVSVSIRALTCLMLVVENYKKRIPHYPKLAQRLELMKDEPEIYKGFGLIYLLMLKAQDTQKVTRTIREEIIPEVMKNLDKLNHGIEEPSEENDYNPDWGNMSPELDEQLQKMNEMIMDGSDVYLSTFSMMKRHDFFKTTANWFLPYYTQHSLVHKAANGREDELAIVDLVVQSSGICDNDKYSMISVFPTIPKELQQSIFQKFEAPENKEIILENLKHSKEGDNLFKLMARNYIQCLYRFFNLYPWHHEFYNIFAFPLKLCYNPYLEDFIHTEQTMREAAEYLFKSQRWYDAIELYYNIEQMDKCTASDYQKMGYCEQKNKNFESAIEYYEKANEMQPNNSWVLRHLATCHRLCENFEMALAYYRQADKLLPNNKNIIYQTGYCLLRTGSHEEALQKFFQLEMMEANSLKVWRAIGWCSFLMGKHEQSVKYYTKALEKAPILNDHLNLGHNYLVMGELPNAIGHYKEALKIHLAKEGSFYSFLDLFDEDMPVLSKRGVTDDLLQFVYDLVLVDD